MEIICMALQLVTGLTILNVWFRRTGKETPFRGGEAKSLKAEFKTYGLNEKMFYLIGALKVGAALGLLVGLVVPMLILPSAILLGLLMVGALVMHLKISDPIQKSIPALTLLAFCLVMIATCEKSFWM